MRSLKTPEVTTCSPSLRPETIASITVGSVLDGRGRHGDGGLACPKPNVCLDEHSGAQLRIRVVERRLDLDVAGLLIDHRVDRGHPAVRLDPRSLGRRVDRRADLESRHLLLRHGEIDVNGPDGLQRHDRRAGLQVLAEVDLPDPQHTREGSSDRLALDRRPNLTGLRHGLLLLGGQPVQVRLGLNSLLHEVFGPLEVQIREPASGLRRGQLRLLLPRVQTHEDGARPDGLSRCELDLFHNAGQIGGNGHSMDGGHTPDRIPHRGPLLLPGDHGGHRLGRRLKGRVLLHPRLNLAGLHGRDRRDENPSRGEHQNHSFLHKRFSMHFSRSP